MEERRQETPRRIELLAPAKDVATAIAAIDHGADAVYIGASAFGARAAAANEIEDIRRLTDYAHQFRARVYATVNTIIYDHELLQVEKLVKDLYRAHVDALIVQDMGLLRLDLPPIELHASTQCDTRDPAKARFLEDVGFSQIVLARELTIQEIRDICSSVKVPVETFVHGALCVSYSGRCHAGEELMRRSANRGRCPQVCRMKFDLINDSGKPLVVGRHLLSLRDFNASASLEDLLGAGVSSFKIEGRLKDAAYVKNITAYYRELIDRIISASPEKYARASCGSSSLSFAPDPRKSFNRGFTSYFLSSRRPEEKQASIYTPKSLGQPLGKGETPSNGDGISFFNPSDMSYQGFRVNKVVNGRMIPAKPIRIPEGVRLYRTFDNQWERLMAREDTARRTIEVDMELFDNRLKITDERGCCVVETYEAELQKAKSEFQPRRIFEKTGATIYRLRKFVSHLPEGAYIPPSILTELRRKALSALDETNRTTYPFSYRRKENPDASYPSAVLDYRDNVANSAAERFYREHGVKEIEKAVECENGKERDVRHERLIMTCRYCILRQLGKCRRESSDTFRDPLYLRMSDGRKLPLRFDCKRCEMQVFTE